MKSIFTALWCFCFMLIAVIGCDQGMNMMKPAVQGIIPDANLAAAIREEIGDSITTDTLLNLTGANFDNRGITDLTGLEHARNLKYLNLSTVYLEEEPVLENRVSDLSPLAGLTKLQFLYLDNNTISDITPLSGLKQLEQLALDGNSISDITPLAGLTQLTYLELAFNTISDLKPLTGLTQLEYLDIGDNPLSDVSIYTYIDMIQAKIITGIPAIAVEDAIADEDAEADPPPEPELDPYQLSNDFTTDNNGAITLIQGNAHLGAGATRGCLFLAGSINGVRYTVHEFKWQTRQNAEDNWTDIDSDRCDDRDTDIVPIYGYDLNAADPGQYRAVLDMTTTHRMKLKTNTVIVE